LSYRAARVDYSRMLFDWDPDAGLSRLEQSFTAAIRASRARFVEHGALEALALDVVLPTRIRNAKQFLRPEARDDALETYIEYVLATGSARIDAAATSDEAAGAVMRALDDLHAYLTAHEIVTDGYAEAEAKLAARLESWPEDESHDTGASTLAGAANRSDLALAA
jgi:hypothetical protein